MAYIKLYCKKKKARPNGQAPIYYVIRIDGKEKLISSGKYINKNDFDNATEQAIDHKKLQIILNREKEKLHKIMLDLEEEGRPITFEYVIQRYRLAEKDNFIQFCFSELEQMKGSVADKTYEDYETCIKLLQVYRPDVKISEVTYDFLKGYEYWLTVIRKRKKNSRAHDFTTIRRFQRIAVRKGLSKLYAFNEFRIQREDSAKEFNTQEELNRLIALWRLWRMRRETGRLRKTLANYIFTCHTGVAGDDMRNKNRFAIKSGVMHFTRGKTDKPVLIPLPKVALRIWEEIKDGNLKKHHWSVNQDLKEIMKIAGIDKDITYHCGRHTFAILSLMKGISLPVISKVLGHTTIKTTEIYAKVVNDLIAKEMRRWDD